MSKEINTIQGSPEWWKLRKGIPTGSQFSRIITAKKGDYAAGAKHYAAELIAEALGWQSGFTGTPDTARGNLLEKEALRWLGMHHGIKARPCGFFISDCERYGASPDGIVIGSNEPVEVKCPALNTFLKWRVDDELPDDHKAQCHGEMILTGADKCYFVAYADHELLDNWLIVVKRDEYTAKLENHLERFCTELEALQRKLVFEPEEIFPYLTKRP
jgi:putative phage-type endonuclease